MTLSEWSQHRDYLGHEDLFCLALLCILATSSLHLFLPYLLLLLGPYHFCPYCDQLCMKISLGVFNFLEEIWLFLSIVFLYFFVLITEESFLISPCYWSELCIQMDISFLFSFAFCFSSFHNCLLGLLRQPFCLFTFIFLEGGLEYCLPYNVMILHP